MNILIVSGYYYPEITPRAFRTTELVEELTRRGHKVTLAIPYREFDYLSYYKDSTIDIVYFNKKRPHFRTEKGLMKVITIIFNKLSYYLFCYPDIQYVNQVYRCLKYLSNKSVSPKFDLLISIAAPHSIHWGCDKFFKDKGPIASTWIADCGDPFMGNQVFHHPFYFKYFEHSFCKDANYIVIPIESAKSAYYGIYHNKIRVIPQGFNFTPFLNIANNFQKSDVVKMAYAGAFYRGYRDMMPLIKYLGQITQPFILYLFTPKSRLVDSYKQILGSRLVIKDPIPRKALIFELSKMDFLINIGNKGNVQLPSKLIDYALAGRPILSVTYPLNSKVIDEFLSSDFSHATKIDNIEDYNIINVVDKFLSL